MPHVSLWGGVLRKLYTFVHRTMAITQLTHLHLTIPSSGTTTGLVPRDCFPIVPLGQSLFFRGSRGNRLSTTLILSGGGTGFSGSIITGRHVTARPGYYYDCTSDLHVWFPFVDPVEDTELLSPPRFPY